jgi:hypothetical protein
MRERTDLGVGITHSVWSEVGWELPLVAGDAAEEDAGSAMEDCLASPIRIVANLRGARRDSKEC